MNKKLTIVAASLAAVISGSAAAQSLAIYAWSGELPQEIIDDFVAETGIDVTMDTFDANETMMAKVAVGASGYDLIEPSQYAVQVLAKQGRLLKLDHSKMPNTENVGYVFQGMEYDPGMQYSVPYVWGTTGLGYSKACFDEAPTSWKALFDPEMEGRIYILDNMLSAYIVGLQVNGFKASTTDPKEIEIATQTLIDQKPLLAGYNSSNYADLLGTGDACVVEGYNNNVAQAIASQGSDKIGYVVPEEGGTMWVDNWAIPANAENVDAAYQFINYIMDPVVAAKTARISNGSTTVTEAIAMLPDEVANNPAIYPPAEQLENVDFILDVGDAMKLYQDGWTQVKLAP